MTEDVTPVLALEFGGQRLRIALAEPPSLILTDLLIALGIHTKSPLRAQARRVRVRIQTRKGPQECVAVALADVGAFLSALPPRPAVTGATAAWHQTAQEGLVAACQRAVKDRARRTKTEPPDEWQVLARMLGGLSRQLSVVQAAANARNVQRLAVASTDVADRLEKVVSAIETLCAVHRPPQMH